MFTPAYSLDCQWMTQWVSRCRIRLVTSNFGTSTGTICVLFDDSCSYDDGNTLSSSLIDNRQFETDINTSFVDSDSWPGLRVCAAMDGRQCHATVEHVFDMVAVIPTSQIRWDLSRIQLIWIDLLAFYCVWLLYNKTVFIWHVYYNKIQHTSGGPVKFISTQYTCLTHFYHFTQPYATSSISSLDNEHTMLLNSTSFESLFNFLQLTSLDYWL